MLKVIFKALIVFWPFLKAAVFKDRTVAEVIKENKHLTAMLVVNILLICVLVITTKALADYKGEYRKVRAEITSVQQACVPDLLEERKKRLSTLLK